MLPQLLGPVPAEVPLLTVTGAGAYGTQPVHAAVMLRPSFPRERVTGCAKSDALAHRNAAIAACRRLGRKLWKSWSGYHRSSLVETKMNCVKWQGERVMSRTFERQVS